MKKVSFAKGAFWILCLFIFAASFFLVAKSKVKRIKRVSSFKGKVGIHKVLKRFPFSEDNSLEEWEEKVLKGRVVYTIEKDQTLSYVRAKSQKAASALYFKLKIDIEKHPVIGWKWRVDKFPKRSFPESIQGIKEEDFAARFYVMFPAVFFMNSKVVEYVWSETMPVGTSGTSGYSKNIKVLVLESGKADGWRFEKRDIYEDYLKLFGEKPRLDIGAIALMTDADSTKTSAEAAYDEIEIGYR